MLRLYLEINVTKERTNDKVSDNKGKDPWIMFS